MSLFKRKITYFYEHYQNHVGNTAGFLKLEIRGDKVKININIQEPSAVPYEEAGLYFYHEAGDHLSAVKVGTVKRVNGMLTYQARTQWQQMFQTGRDLYTFDGVAVVYNEKHYYIGDFQDKNRIEFPLVLLTPKDEKEEVPKEKEQTWYEDIPSPAQPVLAKPGKEKQEKQEEKVEEQTPKKEADEDFQEDSISANQTNVYAKCENCPYQKKRGEQQEGRNAFEKMIKEYPKLPMYGVVELFDCVRIHPRDIGKLDIRNWRLGVNSFLTHGFYTYQYLLLGKVRLDHGGERPIIGVPGVYSSREKYLANMFGFEQFVSVKKTGTKTGEFGYWIVELQ
ncbi:MAG: DUF6128 domain-containing protein [Eubacteriales bacterium]|nr:DUF6128 domain-containing protein [Eubacteriales bacterium]